MHRAEMVDLRARLQSDDDDDDDDLDIDRVDDSVAFPSNVWEEDEPTVEEHLYRAVPPSRSTAMPMAWNPLST